MSAEFGWFASLTEVSKISVLTAAINAVVVGIGYFATYKTSRAGNEQLAKHAEKTAKLQIEGSNIQKLAEFRLAWIEDIRASAAELYRDQYALSLVKRDLKARPKPAGPKLDDLKLRERNLFLSIAKTKREIILRIDSDTSKPEQQELLRLVKKRVSSDFDTALQNRKELESAIGKILQAEWKRVLHHLEEARV